VRQERVRHKRVRRELYGWSCAACAVRCGVPERARGGAWPPEAGRLAPARPACRGLCGCTSPACAGVRASGCAGLQVPTRVSVRAAACAGSCAGWHVPGLCGGWHVPGLWAGLRGGLCLPACTSRPAGGSRAAACAGLCAGACTPGWWAGCSPRPGAGVAGPGCGPARGSACAAVAAFVPGLWAGCGGLRRPCGPCACRVVCVPCLCAWLCVWLRACPRGAGFRGGLCAGFRVGLWGWPCVPAVCAPACGPACAPGCGPARWSASAVACGGFRAGLCARLRVGLGGRVCRLPWGLVRRVRVRVWVGVSGFRRCVCGC